MAINNIFDSDPACRGATVAVTQWLRIALRNYLSLRVKQMHKHGVGFGRSRAGFPDQGYFEAFAGFHSPRRVNPHQRTDICESCVKALRDGRFRKTMITRWNIIVRENQRLARWCGYRQYCITTGLRWNR